MMNMHGDPVSPPDPSRLPYNDVGFPAAFAIAGGAIVGALGAGLLYGLFRSAAHTALRLNDCDRSLDDIAVDEAVTHERGRLSAQRVEQVSRGDR